MRPDPAHARQRLQRSRANRRIVRRRRESQRVDRRIVLRRTPLLADRRDLLDRRDPALRNSLADRSDILDRLLPLPRVQRRTLTPENQKAPKTRHRIKRPNVAAFAVLNLPRSRDRVRLRRLARAKYITQVAQGSLFLLLGGFRKVGRWARRSDRCC